MPFPSKRTPEVIDEVLERLSLGEPLAEICRSDAKFPHPSTWADWCLADEALNIAHMRARDVGFDVIAAGIIKIIDDVEEDPASRRVRAEYRLKLLAKWDPKRYGELVKLGNADGSNLGLDVAVDAARQRAARPTGGKDNE